MKTRWSVLMSEELLNQAGKITVLPVAGGVRPKLETSRMRGKDYHRLRTWFLSKNLRLHKNPSIIVSGIPTDQSLPTT
jgi:hypothetical protein